MKHAFSMMGIAAALALGCSSAVVDPNDRGSGGATSSHSTTSGGSGGSGGEGAFAFGPPGPACDDPSVFVEITGDVDFNLDAGSRPTGFIANATQPDSAHLTIGSEETAGGNRVSITAAGTTWPGSSNQASIWLAYDGGIYEEAPANSAAIEVTTFEMPGGLVEGSFSATLEATEPVSGPQSIQITGQFRACRAPDPWID